MKLLKQWLINASGLISESYLHLSMLRLAWWSNFERLLPYMKHVFWCFDCIIPFTFIWNSKLDAKTTKQNVLWNTFFLESWELCLIVLIPNQFHEFYSIYSTVCNYTISQLCHRHIVLNDLLIWWWIFLIWFYFIKIGQGVANKLVRRFSSSQFGFWLWCTVLFQVSSFATKVAFQFFGTIFHSVVTLVTIGTIYFIVWRVHFDQWSFFW